jgi:cell division inhibitor SepF
MASIWRRAAVYLGLVDDEEYDEYEPYEDGAPTRRVAAVEPEPVASGTIRTLPREGADAGGGVSVQPRPAVVRPIVPIQGAKPHVVAPAGFPDAKDIGDKLKASQPVIVNLQSVDRDLGRRIIDFASGLAYGLGGQMEKVADAVFLLTPANVEISPEEKRRLQERGLYRS